jgi:hypothetical protein
MSGEHQIRTLEERVQDFTAQPLWSEKRQSLDRHASLVGGRLFLWMVFVEIRRLVSVIV